MTPEVQAAVERVKQAVEAWDRYQPGITPRDVIEQALDMRGAIPDLLTALSEANERASILQTALHERTTERDEAREISRTFADHWPHGANHALDDTLRRALCAVPSPTVRLQQEGSRDHG